MDQLKNKFYIDIYKMIANIIWYGLKMYYTVAIVCGTYAYMSIETEQLYPEDIEMTKIEI